MITATTMLFITMVLGSIINWPMYLTLSVGILPFYILAYMKGHSTKSLFTYSKLGFVSLQKTYLLLLLIGATTALWNDSATLKGLITLCFTFINPHNFLLLTFVVTWMVTLLLGSALGTAGTIGVLFITLAENSGYSLAMTGGAIVSAIYLGERTSPVSTCANLVADVNQIKVFDYIRHNFRNSFMVVLITLLLYGLLSVFYPINLNAESISSSEIWTLKKVLLALLPILVLIVTIMLNKNVLSALASSLGVTVLSLLFWGHLTVGQIFNHMLMGSNIYANGLTLSGKGILGMLPTVLVVMISAIYGGLFEGSGIFNPLKTKLSHIGKHYNLYFATTITSLLGAAIGCSQTFSVIFTHHLLHQTYRKEGHEPTTMANHLADTAVLLPALIPWNIAAAVPALLLNTGFSFMPFAFMVYLPVIFQLSSQVFIIKNSLVEKSTRLI